MRGIIVDDDAIILKSFTRLCNDIEELTIVGSFRTAEDALKYTETHDVDIAFLDVQMPMLNGLDCAKLLRDRRPEMLIVFVSAFDEYIRESNLIGGDYYMVKPVKKEVLQTAVRKMDILSERVGKKIYIQMFGKFNVLVNNKPVRIGGKAKEILALIVMRRGLEVSNESIYSTVWEDRTYSNSNMTVYYNALKRLKDRMKEAGIEDLLVSTSRGQMVNTKLFECDYYDWLDGKSEKGQNFRGEFLSDYSWGEEVLAEMLETIRLASGEYDE